MTQAPRRWLGLLIFALVLHPGRAFSATRPGFELAIQHATEDTDGTMQPVDFPVSGSITGTLAWPLAERLRLTTGVGYEERWTTSRFTLDFSGTLLTFDFDTRARSLVVPLRFASPLGDHFELEAGPEWRWMLQTRVRSTYVVPGDAPTTSDWDDVTSGWERSSFAIGAGLAARWPAGGGEAHVGFRWCEALGNQRGENFFDLKSRFRELQLLFGWSR